MKSTSEDMKGVLVSASVGTFAATSGWAIFIGQEPTSPDTVVTLFDAGGSSPNPKNLLDNPNIQVRIRGAVNGYQAAYTKALAVRDALLGLTKRTINNTVYVGVYQMGDIMFIGFDDNSRPLFVTNWRIYREPSSGTYRTAL